MIAAFCRDEEFVTGAGICQKAIASDVLELLNFKRGAPIVEI